MLLIPPEHKAPTVRCNITDDRYMDKTTLDNILEKHKAQPVGHGYIDIIVSRDNYKDFISALVTTGYKIDSVSWWEWCEDKKENEYGLGGSESIFIKVGFPKSLLTLTTLAFRQTLQKKILSRKF